MFGSRRKRASSNPPLNASTADANAATAAASAFLKNQASNASLSAAAAAAALRARPTSPVSVGDVQTKRMLRRAGSNSSAASSIAGSAKGTRGTSLERRGSSGSMSERTFRDPSPARGVPSAPDAPPVPSIPKNITRSLSAAHRRTASLDPPARLTSPPPSKATGRGSSLGPGITATAPRRTGSRVTSLSSVQELTGVERPGSRGSVNFSLPTSSRPTSPVSPRLLTSPSTQRTNPTRITSPTNSNLVYDPNTRSFLPLHEILAIEQRVQDASNEPVKKAKKISPKQNTGRHFADGTVGGRARGTAVDEMEAARKAARLTAETSSPAAIKPSVPVSAISERPAAQPATPAAKKTKIAKPATVGVASDSESDGQSYIPNSSDNESEISSPPSKFTTRAGAMLAKRPSIVREDKEREEEEEDTTPRPAAPQVAAAAARTISPSPLPRVPQGRGHGRGHGRGQASASAAFAQERQHFRSASQPAPIQTGNDTTPSALDGVGAGGRGAAHGGRVHSLSPARTTHFAQVPDHLAVRHSPPPRSISPRKSALKQSSSDSPRGQSPASGVYFGHGSNASETSAGSAGESEEQSLPRKKAVRVSFDESKVIVGRAAGQESFAPSLSESPLEEVSSKRNWLGLASRGKKKEGMSAVDNDEVMQPRPALPSFGSVRERKPSRELVEERPLVKPLDAADGLTGSTDVPFGQSNDHIVGAIISQDHAARNAANISKSREPLPPQVTSVEGSGYHSDGESTIGGDSVDGLDGGAFAAASAPSSSGGQKPVTLLAPITDGTGNGLVPKIALSKATPPLDATLDGSRWPDVPGGWSENTNSDSGSPTLGESPTSEHRAANPTPATVGIAEPLPGEAQAGTPLLGNIASENEHEHPTIIEETEESDATSIYSDAAEELSDVEGGFISLDAVVESPVPESNAIGIATSPPHSPTAQANFAATTQTWKTQAPAVDDSWERAQSYWGSLSAEKKLQIEQEAREEAEASDSTIEAPKQTPKPKKKKAITQQTPAQPVEPEPAATNRTYMILPGSKVNADEYVPTMRSSMRAGPPPGPVETHMRMSLRSQGVMRNSMRGPPPLAQQRGSLVKGRPMSVPNSSFASDPAAVNAHVRALSAVAAARESKRASQPPSLQRRDSGDSESSFKRTRAGEHTSFRRSMRGSMDGQTDRGQSPTQSSRFSLRSLSPTGSGVGRLPFSSASPSSTPSKNSIRTSLRNPAPVKSSKLIPSFGRGSSKLSKGNSVGPRSSRFVDSSDEEGDSRPAFRSRFVDSSDDEGPGPAPSGAGASFGRGTMRTNQAVRGIPRPTGVEDGDSSDLPDSDDEDMPSATVLRAAKMQNGAVPAIANNGPSLGTGTLRRSGSGRDAPPGSFAGASPTRSRGGNLMNILRRKKDPSAKVRKADIESAARRDTPLERSRYDLQAMKRNDSYNSTGSGKAKLQKRSAVTSWPLPPPEAGAAELEAHDTRPHTADEAGGVVGGSFSNGVAAIHGETPTEAVPGLGPRRITTESLPTELGVNGFVEKGRKKKFGKLRRMFRLDE